MDAERFFVLKQGRKLGPFSLEELRQLNRSAPLDPGWLLLGEQSGERFPASHFLGETLLGETPPPNATADLSDPIKPQDPIQHPLNEENFPYDPTVFKLGRLRETTFRRIGAYVLIGLLIPLRMRIGFFQFVLIFGITLISALCFLIDGYINWRRVRIMEDTPTSAAKSAAIGMIELSGQVKSLNNLVAPYSGQPCVVCEYRKEEKGYKGRWRTVDHSTVAAPFLLEDESGSILINPDKAWVDFRTETGVWDYQVYPEHDTRLSEKWIAPRETVYVLGRAETARTVDGEENLVVQKDPAHDFIILRGRENKVIRRLKAVYMIDCAIGVLLFCGAMLVWKYARIWFPY